MSPEASPRAPSYHAPLAENVEGGDLGLPPVVGPLRQRRELLDRPVEHWPLTTRREKPVKIGAKIVGHGRYVTFQLAELENLSDDGAISVTSPGI
mgnify:CR=1 FL=1